METFTSFSYFQGASHLTFPLLVSASLGLSFSGKYSGFLHRQREEEFLDYRERGWKFGGSVFSLSLISIHPISVVSDPSSSWALTASRTWFSRVPLPLLSYPEVICVGPSFSLLIYKPSSLHENNGICVHFLLSLLFWGCFLKGERDASVFLCHLETVRQFHWVWILLIWSKSWKSIKHAIIIHCILEISAVNTMKMHWNLERLLPVKMLLFRMSWWIGTVRIEMG